MPPVVGVGALVGWGGKAPSFAPTDISGLQLWLDASDTSTITESSGAVSQWDDKSGNSRHAVQGTAANQPVTGTATINSLNAIRFDGIDNILQAPNVGTVTALTTLIVAKYRTVDTTSQLIIGASDGGYTSSNEKFLLRTLNGEFSVETYEEPVSASRVANGTEDTSVHVFEIGFDSAATVRNTVDGTSTSTATGAVSLALTDTVDIGAADSGSSIVVPAEADISEVLVYDVLLSGVDLTTVREYLAAKWGVTLS